MRTTLRCKRCGTSLIVEGPAVGHRWSRSPALAPKCQHTNETQWPSDGNYKFTAGGTDAAER